MATDTTTLWRWARANGQTVESLAELLDYSVVYLLGVLSGERPVTDRLVGRFARVFGAEAAAAAFGLGARNTISAETR